MLKSLKVLTSGTLGDAYLNYCRLYALHKQYNFEFVVYRSTLKTNFYFDKPIADMYSLVPFIKYKGAVALNTIEGGVDNRYRIEEDFCRKYNVDIKNLDTLYLRSMYPKYTLPICFPPINIPNIGVDKKSITIQIQAGKYDRRSIHKEMRGFSEKSIRMMCEYFTARGYTIYLIGIKHEFLYPGLDFDLFNVVNLIDKTSIIEAMSLVKYSNFFIGLNGMLAFVASSMRTYNLNFNHLNGGPHFDDPEIGCPCWKKYSLLINNVPTCYTIDINESDLDLLFNNLCSGNTEGFNCRVEGV